MLNLDDETLKIVSSAMDSESDAFEQLVVLFTDTVKSEIKKTLSKNDFYKILYSGIEVAIEDIATEVWRILHSRALSRDLQFETYESFSNYLAIVCRHRSYRYMAVRIRHRTKKGKGLDLRNENSDDTLSEKLIVDRRFTDHVRKNVKFESIDDVGELSSYTSESPEKIVIREQISESIINNLTEKELIIAELSLNKKYQKEIAEELGVSVRTIFNYLKSIEDKSDEKWL